jgi:hypothetical protein
MMVNGNLPGSPGPIAQLKFECFISPDHVVRMVISGANSDAHATRIADWMNRSLQRHGHEIGIVAHEDFTRRLILPAGMKPKQ